ncbi:MAG: hypothetical protein ACREEK_04320 [Bradyrhizobium sp.]
MRRLLLPLEKLQDKLRRTRPTLWHLRTAYVLPFSFGGCLLSIAAAYLVVVDNKSIPAIEPIFLGVLIVLLFVVQLWLVGISRPLRPLHTSTSRYEPLLVLCVIHAMLLAAPAYVFGIVLESRIARALPLSEALAWRSFLTDFIEIRSGESTLAFGAFRNEFDSNAFRAEKRDGLASNELDFEKLRAQYGVPGLDIFVQGRSVVVPYVSFRDISFYEGRYRAPPAAVRALLKTRGTEEFQVAMGAWRWCRFAGALIAPLSRDSALPINEDSKVADAVIAALSAAGQSFDSRELRPYSAGRVGGLVNKFIGNITIRELMSNKVGVKAARSPQGRDDFGFSSLEFVTPIPPLPAPAVKFECVLKLKDVEFKLPRTINAEKAENDFDAANDAFVKQVVEIVTSHVARDSGAHRDFSVIKISPMMEDAKALVEAVADRLRIEMRQIARAVLLLDRIVYAQSGHTIERRISSNFLWPSDWYWFGSWFSLLAVLFVLISASLTILCWRSAYDTQFQAVALFSGALFLALMWSALTGPESLHLVILVTAVASGVTVCVWALAASKVVKILKAACLVGGVAIPFLSYFLFRYFLQSCVGGEESFLCNRLGTIEDFWTLYVIGCLIAFLVAAELFLLAWRRIVVKPNG